MIYDNADDIDEKVFLIEVTSQFRLESSSILVLRDALDENHPELWKNALDGLVTISSDCAFAAMKTTLASTSDLAKKAWIEEALLDAKNVF